MDEILGINCGIIKSIFRQPLVQIYIYKSICVQQMLNQHLMSSSEKLGRLVGNIDRKHHTGPREPEPPEGLSRSRAGLTHVADWILKNSTLKVSLGGFFKKM